MSAPVLQRVVVRMLHDAELRAAVYADPERALAGLDLDADERAQLVRPDPRAWAVDVHRADRVLTSLIEEYPVATLALIEDDGGALLRLRRFFQSGFFHDAIMTRRSLAPAFGEFLASLSHTARSRSFIALETGIAALRRAAPSPSPGLLLTRSPRHLALELLAGTLAAWDRARQTLGPKPAEALLRPKRPRLGALDAKAREHVLLEMQHEPVASFVGESLVRLLAEATAPRSRDALLAVIAAEGADAREGAEILDELVAEGLLVPA